MDDRPCRDRDAYERHLRSPPVAQAWAFDRRVEGEVLGRWFRRVRWRGLCRACDATTRFVIRGRRSPGGGIDFRNDQYCRHCNLFARQRKVVEVLRREYRRTKAKIYLTEQRSRLFSGLHTALPRCELIGSEYLGAGAHPGAVTRGIRHEDVMTLSLADSSLDAVVSCDVLEHIPDPDRALSEFARVLRPGGLLHLTVPFFSDRDESLRRAELRDGQVTHLLPPEHHTNPLTRKGALVFSEFGWDLLPRMANAGFADVAVVLYWSHAEGQLGVPAEYLVGRRSG